MDELLNISDLYVQYNTDDATVHAVNGVNLVIHKGEAMGLVGETGAGKTTTALSILNILPEKVGQITSGSVVYGGKDVRTMNKRELRAMRGKQISMIFQDPMTSLNPIITVGDQIGEMLKLHFKNMGKEERAQRTDEILRLVGIPAERKNEYPFQFSGGMKQRIGIAIALVCQPDLLIADEPTTALDVTIQAQILQLMRELKQNFNTAMIMITHDLGIVARMCEKIAVMYAGKIVEYGTTDEIFYEPKHEYTKGLLRSIPRLDSKDHERLVPIEGTPVDMLNPPKGCPFAPRCGACMKVCLREMPPRTDFSDTHYTQCWLCQKAEFEAAQGGNVQ